MTQTDIYGLLLSHYGKENTIPLPIHLIQFLDEDHAAAAFVSQLAYWYERATINNGWVAKTYQDWHKETFVKEKKIRAICEKYEWIEKKVMKFNGNPTVHYRIKTKLFIDSLATFVSELKAKDVEIERQNKEIGFSLNGSNDNPKNEVTNCLKKQYLYTDTTTDITTETTSDKKINEKDEKFQNWSLAELKEGLAELELENKNNPDKKIEFMQKVIEKRIKYLEAINSLNFPKKYKQLLLTSTQTDINFAHPSVTTRVWSNYVKTLIEAPSIAKFALFYIQYPSERKSGINVAYKRFCELLRVNEKTDPYFFIKIMRALQGYRDEIMKNNIETQYIQQIETFLGDRKAGYLKEYPNQLFSNTDLGNQAFVAEWGEFFNDVETKISIKLLAENKEKQERIFKNKIK